MTPIGVSVVIPAYNEEDNIATTIARVSEVLKPLEEDWEVIVVNDGSTDGTLETARRVAETDERVRVISYTRNAGRGKALRAGFAQARGEVVVSIDADLSYSPEIILEFVRTLQDDPEVDVVLASPYMKGGRTEGIPLLRLLVSRLGNMVLSAAMPGRIRTITCIVRAYRQEVLNSLDLESDGKEIHLEILSKVLALGYRVKEIPAVLRNRRKGYSRFRFRITALSHLLFTFLEKPMLLFGLLGLVLVLLGLAGGGYIIALWRQRALNPERPLMTLMVLLIVTGIQALSFGFIGTQLVLFRREIYRVQGENQRMMRRVDEMGKILDETQGG